MKTATTNAEQEQLARESIASGYVCMLLNSDKLWYVAQREAFSSDAVRWFDQQQGKRSRVYKVHGSIVSIYCAR